MGAAVLRMPGQLLQDPYFFMAENSFLAGKVRRWTLPLIEGRPGPDAPNLKRLRLPQGGLDQIHNAPEGMRYMALIELVQGTVRGNHYHKVKEEHIYVIQGELRVVAEDIQSGERADLALAAGDLVQISGGVAHVLQTVQPGLAIEFSPGQFDAADSFPSPRNLLVAPR